MLKYITTTSADGGIHILASPTLTHRQMADLLATPLSRETLHSAGFFTLGMEGLITIHPGASESLGLGPQPGDVALISHFYAACAATNQHALHA